MVVNGQISKPQIARAQNAALDKFGAKHSIAIPARHIVLSIDGEVKFAGDEAKPTVGLAHAS